MSHGNFNMLNPVYDGEVIMAETWNDEFLNVIANCGADGIGSASEDLTNFAQTTAPNPATLPGDLRTELLTLRYQLKEIIGGDVDWYSAPVTNLYNISNFSLVTGGDLHNHKGIGVDPEHGGGALIGTDAIENSAITSDKIEDGAIINAKLGVNSVETINILDENITLEKLATNIVFGLMAQEITYVITGASTIQTPSSTPPTQNTVLTFANSAYITEIKITPKYENSILRIEFDGIIYNSSPDRFPMIEIFINDIFVDFFMFPNDNGMPVRSNFSYDFEGAQIGVETSIKFYANIYNSPDTYRSIFFGSNYFQNDSKTFFRVLEVKESN